MTRNSERRNAGRRAALVAFAVSALGHLLLVIIVAPLWLKRAMEPPPEPDKPLQVEAVYEEAEPPLEPEPEVAVEPTPPEPEPEVVQLSAEISDASESQGMMVAAREPVEEVPPAPAPEPPPSQPAASEEATAAVEEESPVIMRKPKPSPQQLLMPSAAAYEQMFADSDVQAREHAREHSRGKVLFRDYEQNDAAVRKSLQSFGHDVKPGNHTGVSAESGALGSYLGVIHSKIHLRWANGYLMDLDVHEPPGSPMNNPSLNTKLEFVIRADDGEIEAVNIVESSGQLRFDAQAIAVAHRIGPHPNPPPELVSPNGRVYVHWNFWRDQRQCGLFGASIYIVQEQGVSPG